MKKITTFILFVFCVMQLSSQTVCEECEGTFNSVTWNVNIPTGYNANSYMWSDGSTAPTLTTSTPGVYTVDVELIDSETMCVCGGYSYTSNRGNISGTTLTIFQPFTTPMSVEVQVTDSNGCVSDICVFTWVVNECDPPIITGGKTINN